MPIKWAHPPSVLVGQYQARWKSVTIFFNRFTKLTFHPFNGQNPLSVTKFFYLYSLRWGFFAKIVNGWNPLTNHAKSSILDVWQGSEYTSAVQSNSPESFFIKRLVDYMVTSTKKLVNCQMKFSDIYLIFHLKKAQLLFNRLMSLSSTSKLVRWWWVQKGRNFPLFLTSWEVWVPNATNN